MTTTLSARTPSKLDQATLRRIQLIMDAALDAALFVAKDDLQPEEREVLDRALTHGFCVGLLIEARVDALTLTLNLRDPDDPAGVTFWKIALEPSASPSVQ